GRKQTPVCCRKTVLLLLRHIRSLSYLDTSLIWILLLFGYFRRRRVLDAGLAAAGVDDLIGCGNFAANVTQRYLTVAVLEGQGSDAGNFAHILAIHLHLAPRRGQCSVNLKAGEFAAHLTARPNALHN